MAGYEIGIDLIATDDASPTISNVQDSLLELERSQGNMTSSTQEATTAAQQQSSAFSGLQGSIQGLVAGYIGIKGLQMAGEMISTGEQALKTQAVFASLSTTYGTQQQVLQGLRSSTQGEVSDLALMQEATKAMTLGVVSNNAELDHMAQLSHTLSEAFGQDGSQALERWSEMFSTGRITALKDYGINVREVKDRMKELQDAGMDAADALKQSVFEAGDTAVKNLGQDFQNLTDPVKQLKTTWQNFTDGFDEWAATGINKAVTSFQQLVGIVQTVTKTGGEIQGGMSPEMIQHLNPGASATMSSEALYAQYDDLMAQAKVALEAVNTKFVNDTTDNYVMAWRRRQNDPDVGDAMKNAWGMTPQQVQESVDAYNKLMTDTMIQQGSANQALGSFMMQGGDAKSTGMYATNEQASALSDNFKSLVDQYKTLEDMNQQGLISDDDLAKAGELKDSVGAMADDAKRAADNLANLKLPAAFGETSGGLQGQISDEVIKYMKANGMSEDQIAAMQATSDKASGRTTSASEVFDKTIVPMLATMKPEDAAKAMSNLQAFLDYAKLHNFTPEQTAGGMVQGTGFTPGAGGQQFVVKSGMTPGEVASMLGVPVAQVLQMTGAPNAGSMQPGTYNMGNGYSPIAGFDPSMYSQFGGSVGGMGPGGGVGMGGSVPGQTSSIKDFTTDMQNAKPPIDDVNKGMGVLGTTIGTIKGDANTFKNTMDALTAKPHAIKATLTIDGADMLNKLATILGAATQAGLLQTNRDNGGSQPGLTKTQ